MSYRRATIARLMASRKPREPALSAGTGDDGERARDSIGIAARVGTPTLGPPGAGETPRRREGPSALPRVDDERAHRPSLT